MEKGPEANKLAARFSKMAADGLVDVKFYVRNPGAATTEMVCKEVNNLYEAVDNGRGRVLDFGDRKR